MSEKFKNKVADFILDAETKGYSRLKLKRKLMNEIHQLYLLGEKDGDSDKFDEVVYTMIKMLKLPIRERNTKNDSGNH